ncbi:uracil-DNA glycosylase [Carbonactinospora thermoautotrophica]|uniref:Type-4 uracil-DNA glycosylase n=1 Tax=Carbonactinospora thermoautotrophica TaxID=1469144 RepID=A0A132MY91_9ACTN|nr:UdgX family uracil-DNA binding protein [Carbonactinospora thermoautotrophica]KWW98121.1 uracil-DNA glycosylase [Carbonactinospora thermoautotrophica]KWX02875.1 Phage SPO1 DNA polymerase-related protein [Carbonactinospora thermoautotrophica]KWX08658.1 uracil-DNA glycosylase [Carbonactinospora thermoautotrophica]
MPAVKQRPERPGAQHWIPPGADLDQLREAARACRGCELYENATQTVFGAGSPTARVVLVGEQPGDQEDRQGLPFVGPAGRLLDRALAEVGIERADAYVTNAVKHFRFTQSGPGKRRLHQTPDMGHITACKPWLQAELAILDPEVIIALGATAGRALLGPSFRVTKQRGMLIPWPTDAGEEGTRRSAFVVATVHPSAVLRADDRESAYAGLVADLRVAAEVLH